MAGASSGLLFPAAKAQEADRVMPRDAASRDAFAADRRAPGAPRSRGFRRCSGGEAKRDADDVLDGGRRDAEVDGDLGELGGLAGL
jgi:hypothetical protein